MERVEEGWWGVGGGCEGGFWKVGWLWEIGFRFGGCEDGWCVRGVVVEGGIRGDLFVSWGVDCRVWKKRLGEEGGDCNDYGGCVGGVKIVWCL